MSLLHGWNWPVVAQDTAGVILGVAMIALGLRVRAFANTANSGGDQSGKSNNHDGEVSK